MNATCTINETSSTHVYVPFLFKQASTFHNDYILVDSKSVVAEANSIIQDDHMRYLCEIALREMSDDYTDEEELEWDTLFAQPHVQAGLSKLAEEAKQQVALGEFEEGGFAVE
jgi:hypothetical protein